MNTLYTGKYCEVVPYPTIREYTEREKEAFVKAGYKLEKLPHSRRYVKDNSQFAIVVYNDKGGRINELVYESWAFASCSSANLSGVTRVFLDSIADLEAWRDDFINAIGVCEKESNYPPHRFFMNYPKPYEKGSMQHPAEQILACFTHGLGPAYSFENRAHSSKENRIFDVNTDVLRAWQKDYHAKIQSVASVVTVPDLVVGVGTGALVTAAEDWLGEFKPTI